MTQAACIDGIDLSRPGSHNSRELELMLRGLKPMTSFIAEDSVAPERVGDAGFKPYVEDGTFILLVYRNDEMRSEKRCYCLPTEEWRGRLSNFIFKSSCENDLTTVFTPADRARIEGFLLGYNTASIENHIADLKIAYKR